MNIDNIELCFENIDLLQMFGYLIVGILLLVIAWRLVIYFLDSIVGGSFFGLLDLLRNFPNKLKRKKKKDNQPPTNKNIELGDYEDV